MRDIVTNKFILLNEFDLLKIEDVEKINVTLTSTGKTVKIHVGPYDYFLNSDLKKAISDKISTDLGTSETKYKFAI